MRIPKDTTQYNGIWHMSARCMSECDLNAGRGSTPQFIVSLECSTLVHAAAAYIVTSLATT